MSTGNKLSRFLKFLGKILLGLIFLIILLLFLIHLATVQKRIANRLCTYITTKTKGKIEIDKLEFSLLGNVCIEGLRVWDPDTNQILSAGKIVVTTDIFDIISGNYLFDEVRLENIKGKLTQGKDGLNINFILGAFASAKEKIPDTTPSAELTLHCKNILLKNIDFEFLSAVSKTDIKILLDSLTGNNAAFNTKGSIISADSIYLKKPMISMLMKPSPDTITTVVTSTGTPSFTPDFDIGLGFEFKNAVLNDGHFSLHNDTVIISPRFDPAHLDFQHIQIHLSDVMMHPDTLGGTLHTLAVNLPGIPIHDVAASIKMNRHQMSLSALHVTSNTNEVTADLTASYNETSTSTNQLPDVVVSANAKINPADFSYFLTDDIMKYIKQWKTTELSIDGEYIDGKGNLKSLEVKTINSHFAANGSLNDITNPSTISWQDMNINVSAGADFKSTMAPFIGDVQVPPDVNLQMNTTGNPKQIFVDGKVSTTWGNATAKGTVHMLANDIDLDMKVTSDQLQLSHWTAQTWMGPVTMSAEAKGKIGTHQDAHIKGDIPSIVLMDQNIHQITFESELKKDSVKANLKIADPRYRLQGNAEVAFATPMLISSQFQFDTFQLGRLLKRDTLLTLNGTLAAHASIDSLRMEGKLSGNDFSITNQHSTWSSDTIGLYALLSPDSSQIEYLTDKGKATLIANFDLQKTGDLIEPWIKNIVYPSSKVPLPEGNRTIKFNFNVDNPALLQLLGMNVEKFSYIRVNGKVAEQNHSADLEIHSDKFKGYGVSFDTMYAHLNILGDSIGGKMNGKNIVYDTYDIGNLNFNAKTNGDTTITEFAMSHDSLPYLSLGTRILRVDGGAYFYPYQLRAFKKDYQFDPDNSIFLSDTNVVLHQFNVNYDSMQLSVNGDMHAFEANFRKIDLTQLNPFITADTTIIHKGLFNGVLSYAEGKQLDFKANIDSLILYNSIPLTITLSAVKDQDQVPFEFLLSNENNKVDVHGKYFIKNENVDASVLMNVNNPEMFAFLYAGILKNINGSIAGHATINGPIKTPQIKGSLRFNNVFITTAEPSFTFNIKEDSLQVDNTGLKLDHFTLYDKKLHPLTISGNINTSKLPAYQYEFTITAKDYDLINNPDTIKGPIKGLLSIDTDIKLKGNEKDTEVKADLKVNGNTNLTYVMAAKDDAILNTIGVVEFVDPEHLIDTTKLGSEENAYDSIMSTFPDFNLTSNIKVEDNATLRVITDATSGDYFLASGGANLEMSQDRTGNPQLTGNYTIKKGEYRVSFYGLVKKTFIIDPGSSIDWSGSPETGEMDIRATHEVTTNSLGLIGNEIGENEKSIYKRTLDYIVSINIKGTLEKPVITFSLDLPEQDKSSYPVLANKLDRLRLPEFQSELNKQVFGLLVLGGFMPESNIAEVDQSQVATTAIYNSVNAILASQLNRFASQYVKGVNIDVGITSYADYSTPGGKTQTAMDFRVSKSVLNDRLSFEVGGDFNLNTDQSGSNTGDNYRGDVAIIYDLTGNGDKQLKLFNNESYDIIYQEIRNTGISLIFIREYDKGDKAKEKAKAEAEAKEKAEEKDKENKKADKKSPSGDLGAEKKKNK